jgi:hypothetical protein
MQNGVVTGVSRVGVASSLIKAVPLSQRRAPRAGIGTQISTQVTPFTPLDLFAHGQGGFWYDFSDPTTLFQDVSGTVPVESSGDPVALVLDKSGNGYHATQETNAARPIWSRDAATGLLGVTFDGVDDALISSSVMELQGAPAAHVCLGLRLLDFQATTIVETPVRGFELQYLLQAGPEGFALTRTPSFQVIIRDGIGNFITRIFNQLWRTPFQCVVSVFCRPAFAYKNFRINGQTIVDANNSNRADPVFDAGSITIKPGPAIVTQVVYRVAAPSEQETQQLEQWIGQRTGLVP